MSHILVVFQANTEPVEQLALAVAVGAVEAEALIRLRRLATPDAPEVAHKSYGKLQAADLVWADVIIVGLEAASPNPAELGLLLNLLEAGPLPHKRGWTFGPHGPHEPPTEAQSQVIQALQAAGITLLPLAPSSNPGNLLARMKFCGHLSATPAHD